ncbi:TetR/AcrR family transcriptional regulator [Haloglycomyces albus]|uniref:TetR/AcrR family transcriptional regulator n=1 Tax=Haloglycomyces albus TaxID=526067 RepID=UPI00046D86DB|nr:TetR/AcrR family transcriptional regulator [Haloglycomyces albus]
MPRVSQEHLDSRRHQILNGARSTFARFGYEGATVRRLEEATGLSRGAIFHHFKDKDALFLAVASDDAEQMMDTVSKRGLVGVMQDLVAAADKQETRGWLGTQLEVARRLRTDPEFAAAWGQRWVAIAEASRARLQHQRDIGVLREDVPIPVLAGFLQLVYDGLTRYLATGREDIELENVLRLVEDAVRKPDGR